MVIEWNGLARQVSGEGAVTASRRSETVDVWTIRRGHWKLCVHGTGDVELYDLESDPGEMHNAFADPGNDAVVRDLFGRVCAWQRETADPAALPDPTRS